MRNGLIFPEALLREREYRSSVYLAQQALEQNQFVKALTLLGDGVHRSSGGIDRTI